MSRRLKKFKSRAMFTFVGGVLIVNPAFAQEAAPAPAPQATSSEATTLDTVQVTGLRNSLNQSMGIKRDAAGVVDAISAEDIGKFPDTNLAESLQRITGISIERRDGEGAQVTARGFGPEFNMVTLNGRTIPGADAFGAAGQVAIGGVDGGTRAFNFAQLAAEAISGIEVYKTSRADVPSGGIGATINIQTDKPFNHRGGEVTASAGAKMGYDESQPFDNDVTPEVSGIFSYANADKTWGVGLSASYQKRKGGSVQATENYWNIQPWTGTMPGNPNVTNAPAIGQLYARPNDLRYAFADFERERINGQAVLQFAPMDSLTLTLDYTYSTNEITENRGEQSMWLQNQQYTDVTFDSSAVATPTYLREVAGTKDFGLEQQRSMQKYKLGSLGFNADWQATDNFRLSFDAHNSKTQSLPNDPLTGGGSIFMSVAGTNNCTAGPHCGGSWVQEMWFNGGLPKMAQTWFPTTADALANTNGAVNPGFTDGEIGTQLVRVNSQSQISEIKQGRIDGEFTFDDGRFQFGIDSSKASTHRVQAAEAAYTLGDWSVANVNQDVANGLMGLLRPVNVAGLFDDYSVGSSNGGWVGDAGALTRWAAQNYGYDITVSPQRAADNYVEEKTRAAYMQVDLQGELAGRPTNTRIGVRYEKTDVTSTSMIAIPSAIEWQSNNDFRVLLSQEQQPFTEKSSYSYVLPNLDFSIDLTDTLKGRASFGKSIARAPYGNLYAGPGAQQPFGSVLIDPSSRASGNAQNPALKPLESDNLDLALEWYFADASYVSVTFWNKTVNNFIGNTVTQESLYGLRDPTSGPDAQQALAFLQSQQCISQVTAAGNDPAACSANDTSLFAALAMLRNAEATGGLAAYNGSSAQSLQMENQYDLHGEADDPLYMFNVNRPVNQNKAKLHGWELGGQYFFGDTGFGIYANYTIVDGDVGYNNAGDPNVDQFALTGLSDTANVVLMYEKYGWSARLAWNWRDEYLILANQGASRNPYYVEAYDQLDLNVSYALDDHWSFGFEAINLTGEDVRWHARNDKQMVKLIDQSPRFMLGVRYRF